MGAKQLTIDLKYVRTALDVKRIASHCIDHSEDFSVLIKCMEDKDRHMASKAAWAMSHAVIKKPGILTFSHHKTFLTIAGQTTNNALKRNIMRAWQSATLPEELTYEIAEVALKFLGSPSEDIAIKAFSITVLQNLLPAIPELKEEIVFLLEKEMPHATAAYVSRAVKFMKAAAVIR